MCFLPQDEAVHGPMSVRSSCPLDKSGIAAGPGNVDAKRLVEEHNQHYYARKSGECLVTLHRGVGYIFSWTLLLRIGSHIDPILGK